MRSRIKVYIVRNATNNRSVRSFDRQKEALAYLAECILESEKLGREYTFEIDKTFL